MSLLSAVGRVELPWGTLSLDLHVAAGEVVALVGPNGAGKTSTLLTLLGFHDLDDGQVEASGRVLDDGRHAVPVAKRGLGWVPQAPAMLPRRRVARQVSMFLRADAPLGARGVDGLLDTVTAGHLAKRRPQHLSGGEAQRVAVARALGSSAVVLLDEPTSAQDDVGAGAVRRAIRGHAEAGGAAIVVSHRTEDAYALADRLVVLENGDVVQTGTPSDLAMSPRTSYVAHAVGATVLRGEAGADHVVRGAWGELTVADDTPPGPVTVTVRPGSVSVHRDRPAGSSRNVLRGAVSATTRAPGGVAVRIESTPTVIAVLTDLAANELGLRVGDEVWAAIKANDLRTTPGPADRPS